MSPSQRRTDLLCEMCESFVSNTSLTLEDRHAFAVMFLRQLKQVDIKGRIQAAEILSRSKELPRQVALKLANEKIEVARPILALSPALSELDLISLIAVTQKEHHIAIASRANITPRLVSCLFTIPTESIFRALANNSAAEFDAAQKGILLNIALKNADLATILLNRGDIDHTALAPTFFIVPSSARRSILDAVARMPHRPDEMIGIKNTTPSPFLDDITKAYIDGDLEDASEILEAELKVSQSIAFAMLTDPSPEPFALAMKLLGADTDLFCKALLLQGGGTARSTNRFKSMRELYRWLEPTTAARLLNLLKGRHKPRVDFRYAPYGIDSERDAQARPRIETPSMLPKTAIRRKTG